MTSPRLSILQRRRLIRLVDRLVIASRNHAALHERRQQPASGPAVGQPTQATDDYAAVLAELGLARLAFDRFIKEISL